MLKKVSAVLVPLIAAVSLHAQSPMHDPFDDPFFQDPFGDDIFKEMMQMQRQMDEMFRRMQERINQRHARMIAPLGTYHLTSRSMFSDKGDRYEMVTDIPESKENNINIRVENGMLSISAKIVHEEKRNVNGYVSTSRSVQVYQNAVSLPADADENGIKTEFRNGKLVIVVPKKKGAKAIATPQSVQKAATSKPVATPKPAVTPKAVETQAQPTRTEPKQTATPAPAKRETLPKVDEKLKKLEPAKTPVKVKGDDSAA